MQIRWMRLFFVLLVVTLLNAGKLVGLISIGSLHIRPDLLVILLVFISVNASTSDAILASFMIGFAADISGPAMGPYTIAFGLFGSFISQLQKVVVMKKIIHQAMAIFVVTMLTGLLAQLLLYYKMDEPVSNYFRMVASTAIYSAGVGPVMWMILLALGLSVGPRQGPYRRMTNR
jgi:rod shape-determining protein MreD